MATIEELQQQVAALSAQVAAITAPPTDYYTSQYDGEEVDAAVARAAVGGAIDLSLSNKANQADVDASLSNNAADHPHRNLLDNWCFANPVNQRGSKSYVGSASVGIDRWWQQYITDITVQDGYITASGEWQIEQRFENPIDVTDITISLLSRNCTSKFQAGLEFEDGTESGWQEIGISESAFALKTVTFKQVTKKVAAFRLSFVGNAGSIDLLAAKLELGSQQTLAHQAADGNWVLNELPDYGEQLSLCQRYFQTFATESLRPTDALDFRPVMRANPALSTITVDGKTLYTASADL